MNIGKHLISFFSPLKFGKNKKKELEFESSSSLTENNTDSQNSNKMYWGPKDESVRLICKNQNLNKIQLKQIKSYSKSKVLRDGVKRALMELLCNDIIVIYRENEGAYYIYLQSSKADFDPNSRNLGINCEIIEEKLIFENIKTTIEDKKEKKKVP